MQKELLEAELVAASGEMLEGLLKAASALRIIMDLETEVHRDRVTKPMQ